MNILTRLWLYDKDAVDYKGDEYTDYIEQGDQNKDALDETLGGAELTLRGLDFREEFTPTTKFIWEQYNVVENEETLISRKDLIVQNDYVTQPIMSDDTYFCHHITFLEASAIAQKRIVDNISVTYKLKDVNLFGDSGITPNATVNPQLNNNIPTLRKISKTLGGLPSNVTAYFARKFQWEWATWNNDSTYNDNMWTGKLENIDVKTTNSISFSIPMLATYVSKNNVYPYVYENDRQGFCSVDVKVLVTDIQTGETSILSGFEDYRVDPVTTSAVENNWQASWIDNRFYNDDANHNDIPKGAVLNRVYAMSNSNIYYIKTYARYEQPYSNRIITLNFDPNTDKNKKYSIVVTQHVFNLDDNFDDLDKQFTLDDLGNNPCIETDIYGSNWFGQGNYTNNYKFITKDLPNAVLNFYTYNSDDTTVTLFTSAPPANAYDLFIKAVMCSQDTYKTSSEIPITEQDTVFYLDPVFVEELKNTQIVENTYQQKNLWEIFVEVGKYIHAIPIIKFGDNDRFMVSFTRLGTTQIYGVSTRNYPTKQGIFNQRTMEDYIASTSSYVNNLVEANGIIEEVIAPKSTSEDYLVYNDVAKLITNKNIIELVSLEIKDENSGWTPITDFVFEKSIYELLPITPNEPNNKGIAIYYELGTNEIQGFNYKLPTVSAGQSDYAIKNIIAIAMGISDNDRPKIMVNDYVFRIRYRTKDSARIDQSRPDLRKYLVNSAMDCAPLQYQFNNQQDIVLDAERFGNNIYGKLIKTGNRSFQVMEWVDDLNELKNVGELYRLPEDDNNLYYVANVENTNYGTYMISNVTYSKDYNELSAIIGIPSEPRFYEIATENLIDREVSNNCYLELQTGDMEDVETLAPEKWKTLVSVLNGTEYIRNVMFTPNTAYPKWALTCFKNDPKRQDDNVPNNNNAFHAVLTPISTYSVQNTLNMEYDMVDNLSAGDNVGQDLQNDGVDDKAYRTLSAVQYTDVHGRSDMFDMVILDDVDLSMEQIRELPESPFSVRTSALYDAFKYLVYNWNTSSVPDWETDFINWITTNHVTELALAQKNTPHRIRVQKTQTIDNKVFITYGYIQFSITEIVPFDYQINIDASQTYNGEPIQMTSYEFNDIGKPYFTQYGTNLFSTIQFNAANEIGSGNRGKILLKDNREIIKINTNINLITDSDRFVISGDVWTIKTYNTKLALLRNEVSKIVNNKINALDVIDIIDVTTQVLAAQPYGNTSIVYTGIQINIADALENAGIDYLSQVNALALVQEGIFNPQFGGGYYNFIIAKNVTDLGEDKKLNWRIVPKDEWDNVQ